MERNVNLIEHLPTFIQVYREITSIMNAENPEFQLLCDESERIKNNQFIQSCDEDGIARFEKMLKINSTDNDTLESRISRVLVRWNEVVPYTWKVFLRKMDVLCGVGNYEIIPNFNEYTITIITHLDFYGQLDELQNLIDYMIPANLVVIVENELNYTLNNMLNTSMGMSFSEVYTSSNE